MVADAGSMAESLALAALPTSCLAFAPSSAQRIAAFAVASFELVASFRDDCCRSSAIDVKAIVGAADAVETL